MASLERGSGRLWAHFAVTVLFSLASLYVIWIIWVRYLEIEQRFRLKKRESNFTLMISELPTVINARLSLKANKKNPWTIWNDESLYEYVSRLFAPFQIDRARLAVHTPLLRSLLEEEKSLKCELEKANELVELENTEPMIKDPVNSSKIPFFGSKRMIPAREYYQQRLLELSNKIRVECSLLENAIRNPPPSLPAHHHAEGDNHLEKISNVGKRAHHLVNQEAKAVVKGISDAILPSKMQEARLTSVGFVTFVSMKGAHLCRQALLASDPSRVVAVMAPSPDAINWEFLHIHKRQKLLRKLAIVAASTGLIIFWSVLVALLAQVFNVKMLQQYIPSFVDIVEKLPPALSGTIFSLMPTVATSGLMFLLIPILTILVTKEAYYDKTEADRSLLRKYFIFLLFNVLLAASITPQIPSLVKSLEQGVQCENSNNQLVCFFLVIANTLGSTLPQSSFFFVNYVLNAVGMGCMLALLRVGGFVIFLFKSKFSKTTIEKESALLPGPFNYAVGYGINLSFFSIILTFSVLVPITPVLGFFYFYLIRFVTKFNVAVVYQPSYERGGRLSTTIFPLLFVCVIVFQLTMLGIFVVYGGSAQSTGMIVLISVSSVLYYLLHARYSKASQFIPLDFFARDEEVHFDGDIYLQEERKVKNSIFDQPIEIIE
eukprot:TRINITY_DN9952_c0_g2_i2.p1 TRINITY_DN9952_c0_g2~~TRINITY_DN9952_c0_g2_i2.p1  ORF type:complete len:753 (+),score=212.27 TRINITY_DN9952_c0_g2_i2:282-2261(+)